MTSTTERPRGDDTTTFRLVGGKGGVGKTTCAAAIAVAAARGGRRTLVISTDPAPSLGDALGVRLGASPRRVPLGRASLHAVEIAAPRALDAWLASRRERLERIAYRGTWLDRDDVARLLRLSLPGIDEIAGLFEIVRFARSGRYDLVVVDTAPTGHTLRFLAMPDTLRSLARVFDHLQEKHRVVSSALTGRWVGDPEDALIAELDAEGRDLGAMLRDPERVRTSWVTLAEPMAVEETLDALRHLAASGIPVHDVVLNRLTPAPDVACRRCATHIDVERRSIRSLRRALTGMALSAVSAREREPVGAAALGAIGRELKAPFAERPPRSRHPTAAWTARVEGEPPNDAVLTGPGTRLIMFGGKGGVGKTTCAAAAAIHAARRAPSRRLLLLSTDPAHSVADALSAAVTDDARPVRRGPRNLDVRELDAGARFESIRRRYAAAIDGLFDRLSRGTPLDARHDRLVMHDLLDLAPPGIDELVAIADVLDALEGKYDMVVMDTAPSGHALRLLETPGLVHEWAKALMAIVLKYQPVMGVGELGEVLLKVSQGIGRLKALLTDAARTRFVVVTRAAALPRVESTRLLARLDAMTIATPVVVVNAFGKGVCAFCRRAGAAETRELARLVREVRGRATAPRTVIVAPSRLPPPNGVAALYGWRDTWRVTEARAARAGRLK